MMTESGGQSIEFERYRYLTKQVARCLMRDVRGDLDVQGMDFQDYEHELAAHMWLKLHEWRTGPRAPKDASEEHRYVCKCVWNKARSFARRRSVVLRHLVNESRSRVDGIDHDYGFEERAIVRQTLRMLRTRLDDRDWQVLCQIATDEGSRSRGSTRQQQRERQRVRQNVRYCRYL